MGLFSSKPKIKVQTTKKDGFSGWLKCTHCTELIHAKELEQNLHCCSKCNYHYRFSASLRIELLADKETFVELYDTYSPTDPLNFVDSEPYVDRIARGQEKTKRKDAAVVGVCEIDGKRIVLGILDFDFMGGSMGSVVGEKLTLIIEKATVEKLPLVLVSASGGARMQESILSLMQMAKTSAALARYSYSGLPYISVLTNPTTGGVTASFATLGDVIIAEPGALVGFAGPRVVEQTTREKLPLGAQKSEFLLERGMIDCIVNRHQLKDKVSLILKYLTNITNAESKKTDPLPEKLHDITEYAERKGAHAGIRTMQHEKTASSDSR